MSRVCTKCTLKMMRVLPDTFFGFCSHFRYVSVNKRSCPWLGWGWKEKSLNCWRVQEMDIWVLFSGANLLGGWTILFTTIFKSSGKGESLNKILRCGFSLNFFFFVFVWNNTIHVKNRAFASTWTLPENAASWYFTKLKNFRCKPTFAVGQQVQTSLLTIKCVWLAI